MACELPKLTFIPFNQRVLISQLESEKHKILLSFVRRFGGLCELICNRILIDDLLGNGKTPKSIENHVTIERMNDENIMKSHILDIISIFARIIAFLFGKYPDNIFSYFDQKNLISKFPSLNGNTRSVSREILGKGIKNLVEGETNKLHIFSKRFFSFSGHSTLIKRMQNDKYIFFDPNSGEHRDLSFSKLCDKIDQQLKMWEATDLYFTRGQSFIDRLRKKVDFRW
ncbi:MAG: hypothetical protein KR126chlam3_01059 [Chlamydiae bacterium]|nr:hypothetical protein [Chlamydiota bacterium]